MKAKGIIGYYIILCVCAGFFLWVEHLTHFEFLLHLAAIPLEVLVAVFIVERFLEHRERKDKRRQLMYIKSYLFRSGMRNLFVTNFAALKSPSITMNAIKRASLEDLKRMRKEAEHIEYQSSEAMEPVIREYVKAQDVWNNFLNRAITYNFEEIFQDMIYILHFIYDVKSFQELNPGEMFMSEAERNDSLMAKVRKVLEDGIRKFLEYAIEIKTKQPAVFEEILADYEAAVKLTEIRAEGSEEIV